MKLIESYTTTHDSIPAETGKNDGDGTSGDCISRTQAIDALRDYLIGKRCPDDGTLTCRLIENEVINKLPSAQPSDSKIENAIRVLQSKYNKALSQDYIRNPIAWALYQTWKEFDR